MDIKHSPDGIIPQKEWVKLSVTCRREFVDWLSQAEALRSLIEAKVDDLNLRLNDPYEVARILILLCYKADHPAVLAHSWVEEAAKGLGTQ